MKTDFKPAFQEGAVIEINGNPYKIEKIKGNKLIVKEEPNPFTGKMAIDMLKSWGCFDA